MVKGTAKQAVIVLPGTDDRFEQAIFILSPGSTHAELSSPGEMLSLADSLAVRTAPQRRFRGLLRAPWAAFSAGCILTGLVCYLSSLLL